MPYFTSVRIVHLAVQFFGYCPYTFVFRIQLEIRGITYDVIKASGFSTLICKQCGLGIGETGEYKILLMDVPMDFNSMLAGLSPANSSIRVATKQSPGSVS
jgi:hypothetical protein